MSSLSLFTSLTVIRQVECCKSLNHIKLSHINSPAWALRQTDLFPYCLFDKIVLHSDINVDNQYRYGSRSIRLETQAGESVFKSWV